MEVKMRGNKRFVLTSTRGAITYCHVDLAHDAQLWHNWLGHLSYDGLKTLVIKQIVNELPLITVHKDHVYSAR